MKTSIALFVAIVCLCWARLHTCSGTVRLPTVGHFPIYDSPPDVLLGKALGAFLRIAALPALVAIGIMCPSGSSRTTGRSLVQAAFLFPVFCLLWASLNGAGIGHGFTPNGIAQHHGAVALLLLVGFVFLRELWKIRNTRKALDDGAAREA